MKALKTASLLLFTLLAGLQAASAQSYTQFHESYAVTVERLLASEGSVDISYAIDVFPQKVRRTESVFVQFYLAGDGRTATLNSFQINGKHKERNFIRANVLGRVDEYRPVDHVISSKSGSEVIRYDNSLPYEDWMQNAVLYVRESVSGCCNHLTENTFAIHKMAVIPLAPKPPAPVVQETPAPQGAVIPEPQARIKEASATLVFPQGGTELDLNLNGNRHEWSGIIGLIRDIESAEDARIFRIELTGYASPEGPYALNEKLAANRARVVRDQLLGTAGPGLSSGLIAISSAAEDWDGLVRLIETADFPYRQDVLDIINTVGVFDGREKALMQLSGGNVYRMLLKEFFPTLRRTEYRIIYEVK